MTQTAAGTPTKKGRQDIISLGQFEEHIPDEAAAVAFAEEQIWGTDPRCGHCGSDNVYRVASGKPMSHRCRTCKRYFSVRIGNLMEGSNLPVRTWLLAIHLIHTGRKGTSAMQLHKLLGVDYRTSWFLCHRIREAMKQEHGVGSLSGVVEVDETYIGGKAKNMHASKKKKGNPNPNKFAVVGLKAHDGRVIAFPVSDTTPWGLARVVRTNVEKGSTVYSDGHPAYQLLAQCGYTHSWVNHSVGQYVNGQATTNGIESFWALLKRGYVGTFHFMSWKHLARYCSEFAYRQSAGPGNGFRTMGDVLRRMDGKRLTWERLTAT